MKYRMALLPKRDGDDRLHWRGTGFCLEPGGMTQMEDRRFHWLLGGWRYFTQSRNSSWPWVPQ